MNWLSYDYLASVTEDYIVDRLIQSQTRINNKGRDYEQLVLLRFYAQANSVCDLWHNLVILSNHQSQLLNFSTRLDKLMLDFSELLQLDKD
ncbi:hypothetical protein BDD26_0663 [Xenorhabdus cabanillasii]|uniref:Uncharacterized protein n=1 Tax=Xenorhabdus cabanillasii TaxID=351673 RepID=A0A3D9UCK4_9GAMM|nr:hypothetical protein [Xenorhabdus cabanillasii]REF26083.1 hypothetical protein BDD26_0663 [Xenorhabdus cabanillasii]